MVWVARLQFDGAVTGNKIKQSTCMIHSQKASLPEMLEPLLLSLCGSKIEWRNCFIQVDFYFRE